MLDEWYKFDNHEKYHLAFDIDGDAKEVCNRLDMSGLKIAQLKRKHISDPPNNCDLCQRILTDYRRNLEMKAGIVKVKIAVVFDANGDYSATEWNRREDNLHECFEACRKKVGANSSALRYIIEAEIDLAEHFAKN